MIRRSAVGLSSAALALLLIAAAPEPGSESAEAFRGHEAWIRNQYTHAGSYCCSAADGRVVELRRRGGHYEVFYSKRTFTDGTNEWLVVSDLAVLPQHSPIYSPIAWISNGIVHCLALAGASQVVDPCLPAVHSAATLRAWSVWGRAHPWWKPAAIAVGCASAAGVPFAVFYPYAPPPPPVIVAPTPPPAPLSAPGFYIPPPEGSEFSPYVPSGEISPTPTGFSPPLAPPSLPPMSPALPPGVVPPTSVGFAPPQENVPEPATWMLLAAGAGAAVLVRRKRRARQALIPDLDAAYQRSGDE